MSSIKEVNFSFFYFLIFTLVSSALAFTIVIKAYDNAYADENYYLAP